MAAARNSSNKAKIARRVIEVLEFFDDENPEATVMDIVRRYDRPQSSTSELLSSLVDLGILHKDPYSRSYRPTVRAALLGTTAQDKVVKDGRLVRFMDRLVSQTGQRVILFGKTGLCSQIVSTRRTSQPSPWDSGEFHGGRKEPLNRNAAGWLLLATLEPAELIGALRRLNAEAGDSDKFNHAEMLGKISECAEGGLAFGPAGYGSDAQMVASLLPNHVQENPLAVGILLRREQSLNQHALAKCIADASCDCLAEPVSSSFEKFSTAA